MTAQLALTLDIDWAPDFAIREVADLLLQAGVKATWFATHKSPMLKELAKHTDLFEIGIHPNFLPGSSHGKTYPDVLRHCLQLVPKATSMRAHALAQSTPILHEVLLHTPIQRDASIFMQNAKNIQPFRWTLQGRSLWRIPYYWEDDIEMSQKHPQWNLNRLMGQGPGLKIFNFHPLHIAMNAPSLKAYERLKARQPQIAQATAIDVARGIHHGQGTRTLFEACVKALRHKRSFTLKEMAR